MTPDEREEMDRLCARIAVEKDHDEFTRLVKQLQQLLDRKDRRFETPKSGSGSMDNFPGS